METGQYVHKSITSSRRNSITKSGYLILQHKFELAAVDLRKIPDLLI